MSKFQYKPTRELLQYCRSAEQREVINCGISLGHFDDVHAQLDLSRSTVSARVRRVVKQAKSAGYEPPSIDADITDISPVDPADGDVPISELIERRITASKRHAVRAAAHTRQLELPPQPVGIMVFGDPHVDNEGCDWETLHKHIELCKSTDGVYAACVGDVQDNWIGRLQRLYSQSSILASDGWRLSEWLLGELEWLAIVGGNHDQWAHGPGVDPLKWISADANVRCYANDEIRITLNWKGRPDLEPIVWILRHDFSGRSWYHPTHGPHKEAMLDGRCHLLTAGHIHQWGQLTTEQRHGRVTHALRVRGYKNNDTHARRLNFPEQQHGEV